MILVFIILFAPWSAVMGHSQEDDSDAEAITADNRRGHQVANGEIQRGKGCSGCLNCNTPVYKIYIQSCIHTNDTLKCIQQYVSRDCYDCICCTNPVRGCPPVNCDTNEWDANEYGLGCLQLVDNGPNGKTWFEAASFCTSMYSLSNIINTYQLLTIPGREY